MVPGCCTWALALSNSVGGISHLRSTRRSIGMHVSLELALHHPPLGINRGLHRAVGTDGQTIVLEGDATLDMTIDIKVLAARQFALDDHGLANLRQICRQRSTHGCSP